MLAVLSLLYRKVSGLGGIRIDFDNCRSSFLCEVEHYEVRPLFLTGKRLRCVQYGIGSGMYHLNAYFFNKYESLLER